MKKFLALLFISTLFLSVMAQKKNSNTKPYPLGNPVITHMYTADAAPHVMPDGRVWMVTSVDGDPGGGYSTMHSYHTFSSADMVNWTDHGEILNITDLKEPEGEDWALWAPDMIYRNGKYYLYFPVRIIRADKSTGSWIAVAVSDSPDKHFTIINPKIEGTSGIDPAIFGDDDGELYLYWGGHWVAKVADNMTELATKPVKLEVDADHFMEASWMHKHNGRYYFNYHTIYDKPVSPENPDDPQRRKSQLDYSWGNSPTGPLKYGGVLNYELGVGVKNGPLYPGRDYVTWRLTQSNHGGIVEYHGQDYLFYHTSALSSWRQDEFKAEGTWTQRSVCIDKIFYNDDGSVIPVKQTVEGVPAVQVNQPFEIVLQKKKVNISDNSKVLKFNDIHLGSGYYYFGLSASNIKHPIKAEIRLDKPDGLLIGTVIIRQDGVAETFLRNANGNHSVYLVFNGEASVKGLRFFAGSPTVK